MVSPLEQKVRKFCMSQGEDVSSSEMARRCAVQLGISYKTAEAYVFAFSNGYNSHGEYQETTAVNRGFDSLADYYESLAIKKGFRSYGKMQNAWARKRGYRSINHYKLVRKKKRLHAHKSS